MMRHLILILILAGASFGAENIKNPVFSASFPEGNEWSKVEELKPGDGVFVWMQKEGDAGSLVVVRGPVPLKGSKEQQLEGYRKGIAEKCDELLSAEEIRVDSWPAYKVIGKKRIEGKTFHLTSLLITKGGPVYTITRVSSDVPEKDQRFIDFIQSVRLEK